MKNVFVIIAAVGLAAPALAGSLINKDSKSYKYSLRCGSTTHTSINSNTTASGGAKKGCVIKLDNGSELKIDKDADVVIKDGKVSWK